MFGIFKKSTNELIVNAPVSGTVKSLKKVNDQVFSEEMIGPGLAIIPEEGKVYGPFDGKVKVSFPTGHAFGIEAKNKVEILIHIGVDTVELNGKGFNKKVESGHKVDTSKELCDFDLSFVKHKAKASDVIVVATNESIKDYKLEKIAHEGNKIKHGQPLFKLVKK